MTLDSPAHERHHEQRIDEQQFREWPDIGQPGTSGPPGPGGLCHSRRARHGLGLQMIAKRTHAPDHAGTGILTQVQ